MNKINLADIKETERKSPSGKFHSFRKDISEALGREPMSLDLMKRHPFDLAQHRLPPGAAMCPYHSHSAQWELYLVISGRGEVRDATGKTEVQAGDVFVFPPSEAHQLTNIGTEDFIYCVIADNPVGDSCHYPDSGKWAVLKSRESARTVIRGTEADYFDGEDENRGD